MHIFSFLGTLSWRQFIRNKKLNIQKTEKIKWVRRHLTLYLSALMTAFEVSLSGTKMKMFVNFWAIYSFLFFPVKVKSTEEEKEE